MLFKRNDKIAIVVKPKTHNGLSMIKITSIVMAILERGQSFSFLKTQSLIGTLKLKILDVSI